MPKPTDHDQVVAKKREEARQWLIDQYMQIAIEQSDEYGFLNVMGHEVPDPTVVEPPIGYVPQADLMEQMRAMVRREISAAAAANEQETFEEADDFDIEDDPVDYTSPYEMFFDPQPGAPVGPQAGGGGAQPPSGEQNAAPKAPPAEAPAEPAPPAPAKPTTPVPQSP